jgi:hypothetical protein
MTPLFVADEAATRRSGLYHTLHSHLYQPLLSYYGIPTRLLPSKAWCGDQGHGKQFRAHPPHNTARLASDGYQNPIEPQLGLGIQKLSWIISPVGR